MVDVFKDHGVIRVVDTWGDDIPDGEVTSFPMAVKAEDDKVVVLSWLVWPSRDARMAGVQKIMADPASPMSICLLMVSVWSGAGLTCS